MMPSALESLADRLPANLKLIYSLDPNVSNSKTITVLDFSSGGNA